MPRFFFNVHDGAEFLDTEGVELVGWEEAQVEALRFAGAVIADNAKKMKLGEDWALEVCDANRLTLFRLDFHVTAAPVLATKLPKP